MPTHKQGTSSKRPVANPLTRVPASKPAQNHRSSGSDSLEAQQQQRITNAHTRLPKIGGNGVYIGPNGIPDVCVPQRAPTLGKQVHTATDMTARASCGREADDPSCSAVPWLLAASSSPRRCPSGVLTCSLHLAQARLLSRAQLARGSRAHFRAGLLRYTVGTAQAQLAAVSPSASRSELPLTRVSNGTASKRNGITTVR